MNSLAHLEQVLEILNFQKIFPKNREKWIIKFNIQVQ